MEWRRLRTADFMPSVAGPMESGKRLEGVQLWDFERPTPNTAAKGFRRWLKNTPPGEVG